MLRLEVVVTDVAVFDVRNSFLKEVQTVETVVLAAT
jgi:hypothetical protein